MPLPERPNLRHLKSQAQDLIDAGQATSVADAQFQVARHYGFASWPKLKSHVEAVTVTDGDADATLTSDALIDTIITFLTGQDRVTLEEVRGALRRELEAAGPVALLALHERLISPPDWDFYPADPVARRVHHLLADRLIDAGSGVGLGGGSSAMRSWIWTCQPVTRTSSMSRRSSCCFWVSSRVSITAWMRAAKSCTRRRSLLSRASSVRSSARLVRLSSSSFRRDATSMARRCISGSSMNPPW